MNIKQISSSLSEKWCLHCNCYTVLNMFGMHIVYKIEDCRGKLHLIDLMFSKYSILSTVLDHADVDNSNFDSFQHAKHIAAKICT